MRKWFLILLVVGCAPKQAPTPIAEKSGETPSLTRHEKKNVTPLEVLFPAGGPTAREEVERRREEYRDEHQKELDRYHAGLARHQGADVPQVTVGALNASPPRIGLPADAPIAVKSEE